MLIIPPARLLCHYYKDTYGHHDILQLILGNGVADSRKIINTFRGDIEDSPYLKCNLDVLLAPTGVEDSKIVSYVPPSQTFIN
jgi:hypothetical protein